MAFPATNTVTTTTNDHEYDAKAHTEYDIHRRRAHKLSDAKSHKARVTSKSDRAWRATPRPPVNLRHIRRRSAVFEDDDDDFGDDDSEPVDSDGGDDPPEIQTHGESHPVEDVATLSDLIARQTRQRDFLHVSDFYYAQPAAIPLPKSQPPSPNPPRREIEDSSPLLGADLGFGQAGTWTPSKRDSGAFTMHMRSPSFGNSQDHEPGSVVHVMDSEW